MAHTNLLFIMADEHTRHVLGCYGNSAVSTPNLDRLAENGTRFENAYCNFPICVPARAVVATGRYGHQIGSWDNATPYTGEEAPSWGHRLADAGHKVTTIGKLHYRQVGDPTGFADQRIPLHVLDAVGDLYGNLRGDMPVNEFPKTQARFVKNAGPGDSEYTRYDREVARQSVRWLKEEGTREDKPWALFVSMLSPHFPLIPPQEYFDLYAGRELPWPIQWQEQDWPRHPLIDLHRRQAGLDHVFTADEVQNALAAYYALVSFVDAQVGVVLDGLAEAGLADSTRVIYTSDHGDMVGEHGFWYKSTLFDGAAGVPLIVSGPGVPAGKVVKTNVSHVDLFPSILDAVGVDQAPEDADLPGTSLWPLASGDDQSRRVFAEYHSIYSESGEFMIRDDQYKYIHYVNAEPFLFDLVTDPDETHNLAPDPAFADIVDSYEFALRGIVDMEAVDKEAKADQERRMQVGGGRETIIAQGQRVSYSPVPTEFGPEAR